MHTVKLTLTAYNEGTKTAYKPKFDLVISPEAEYLDINNNNAEFTNQGLNEEGDRKITIIFNGNIDSHDSNKFDFYLKMKFGEKDETPTVRNLLQNEGVTIVKDLNITLCLTNTNCSEGDAIFCGCNLGVLLTFSLGASEVNE